MMEQPMQLVNYRGFSEKWDVDVRWDGCHPCRVIGERQPMSHVLIFSCIME